MYKRFVIQENGILKSAKIAWLENGEPYSEQFQDFYFSTDGGFIETEYVFLKHNGFPQRFQELLNKPAIRTLKIGETGFGTGLNFLVTAYHWLQFSGLTCTLEYTSVEKYPLTKSQLKRIYDTFCQKWPQLAPYCVELLQQYPQDFVKLDNSLLKSSEIRQFQLQLFDGKVQLNLLLNDATTGLRKLLSVHKAKPMDAWYLDGFSPAKNPGMWGTELFETIAKLSHIDTTISTFTAASSVRHGLTEAGFTMSKAPGLGKKREILFGVKL